MKRLLSMSFIILTLLTLTACVPGSEQVMPPVAYTGTVKFHSEKNAILNWQLGKVLVAHIPTTTSTSNEGIIVDLADSAISNYQRKHHPSFYTYQYGKAQEAVFMTSLQQQLEKNNMFKSVKLTTSQPKLASNDVEITVYFKQAQVHQTTNYPITLDVELIIKEINGKTFKRNYFINSKKHSVFSFVTIKDEQEDVSSQLMQQVMNGLQQWYKTVNA